MSTNIAYYKQLDGLRAFAVIAVIISHWFPHTHFLNSYLPLGILGVCLFFVLSGFLGVYIVFVNFRHVLKKS